MNYKTLLIFLISLVAFSCSDNTPTVLLEEDKVEKTADEDGIIDLPQGIHWREDIAVFEFEREVAQNWKIDSSGFILMTKEQASEVEGIKSGDVIVAWDMFIVFVDEISTTESDETLIKIRTFALADAIYGEFNIPLMPDLFADQGIGNVVEAEKKIDLKDLVSKLPLSPGLELEFTGHLKFPMETQGSFEGRIPFVNENYECAGRRKVTVGIIFKDHYCVDHLKAVFSVGFDAQAQAKLTFGKKIELVTPGPNDPQWTLDALNATLPPIILSGVLSLKPYFYVSRQMKLTAGAEGWVSFTATMTASIPIGFEYVNPGYSPAATAVDGFSWIPNQNNPIEFTKSLTTDADGKVELVFHQHVGIGLGFKITPTGAGRAGLKGISFEANLNEDININPFKSSECLDFEMYFDVKATSDLKLFNEYGPDFEWRFFADTFDQVFVKKSILAEKNDTFCIQPSSNANKIRMKQVKEGPMGKEDGDGFDLDQVSIIRKNANGVPTTIKASSASGGTNASKALELDATTCSNFENNVALIKNGYLEVTFDGGLKPNDELQIFQFDPSSRDIGGADCRPSGRIQIEVFNGSSWNVLAAEVGAGSNTIPGSLLVE